MRHRRLKVQVSIGSMSSVYLMEDQPSLDPHSYLGIHSPFILYFHTGYDHAYIILSSNRINKWNRLFLISV